jgi:type IX secretion system PorP/SprF family membrane protein
MKRIFTLSVIVMMICSGLKAQDVHFSQFFEAPQLVNPALTGYFVGDHRFIANFKDQWKTIGSPYRTYAFAYDMGINKTTAETGYLSLGAMVFADKAGDLNLSTMQGILNIAYHLRISDNQTLGAAISGGFGQKSIDMTAAQWDNQYDINVGGFNSNLASNETNPFNTFTYPDLGFGMLYTVKSVETNMTSNDGFRANMGFGVHHINAPKMKFYSASDTTKLSTRISGHGQFQFGIPNSNLAIVPGFFYYNQGKMQEIYVGANFRYMLKEHSKYTGFINDAYFTLGGYHRLADAAIIFAQIELNDIALGVSYDVNVSKLRVATTGRGGLEVSLRYVIAPITQKSFY